jgi:hypothetical protein
MRRLEKMEIEKKEALKAAEARSTCEQCGFYVHVQKDCPEEAKMLDYMRKGDLSNFRYGKGEDHVWFEDRWMVASLCDE